jgi:hypothetical protein
MSTLLEAVGWLCIAVGGYSTWQDSRILFLRRYWRGDLSRAKRRTRHTALTKLRWSLLYVALGVIWVTGWYTNPVVAWLLAGYAFVLGTYEINAWIRSRKRRNSGAHADQLS